MRLTEEKLRSIIKEEYLRVTPVKPGNVMSEARALYLADEVLQEGWFSNLFAGVKGAAGKAGEKASAAGEVVAGKAEEAGRAISAAAQKFAAPIKAAGETAMQAMKDIKDAGVRAAAENAASELKAALEPMIKQQVAELIKKEVQAGKDEAAAKMEANALVMNALAAALLGIGT
jgi:hypothetical protein